MGKRGKKPAEYIKSSGKSRGVLWLEQVSTTWDKLLENETPEERARVKSHIMKGALALIRYDADQRRRRAKLEWR